MREVWEVVYHGASFVVVLSVLTIGILALMLATTVTRDWWRGR